MDQSDAVPEGIDALIARVGELRQRYAVVEAELRVLGEEPEEPATQRDDAPDAGEGASNGAAVHVETDGRLAVATSLAVAGETRTQADEYLQTTFGTDDNDEVLDEVFGDGPGQEREPEKPGKRRWPSRFSR